MLRRLVWSSVPSRSFIVPQLVEIVTHSRFHNERDHLSGMLVFTGVHFMGVLEGHESDLDSLWLRLEKDTRHRDLIRIGSERCGARRFPAWTFAYGDHAILGARICSFRSPARVESAWDDALQIMTGSAVRTVNAVSRSSAKDPQRAGDSIPCVVDPEPA
jgi:hypothetical protein